MPIEFLYTTSEIITLNSALLQKEVLTADDLQILEQIQTYFNS